MWSIYVYAYDLHFAFVFVDKILNFRLSFMNGSILDKKKICFGNICFGPTDLWGGYFKNTNPLPPQQSNYNSINQAVRTWEKTQNLGNNLHKTNIVMPPCGYNMKLLLKR